MRPGFDVNTRPRQPELASPASTVGSGVRNGTGAAAGRFAEVGAPDVVPSRRAASCARRRSRQHRQTIVVEVAGDLNRREFDSNTGLYPQCGAHSGTSGMFFISNRLVGR